MQTEETHNKALAWKWVPSLSFASGLPYVVVMTISVIMYKRMGVSNTEIALYTSWLYLPWVIKPLWSPLVDIIKTNALVHHPLVSNPGSLGINSKAGGSIFTN